MTQHLRFVLASAVALILLNATLRAGAAAADDSVSKEEAQCKALVNLPNLTILSADLRPAAKNTPQYCYVMGLISPAIHWHMQLPLPANWNGRLLNIGDGGKDGDLDFADHRLAQGYAVANSNTGHDNGSEPYASFAFNNRQSEIDFGYRAIHVTAVASKTLVKAYYGKAQEYSYFEGCSTGGRQGMMEAQRFPYDFNGIVAGAPVIYYQRLNMAHVWSLQRLMKDRMAGSLAYDIGGDGSFTSLTKLNMLRKAVMAKCDAKDGIQDGVIDDPLACDFKPEVDLGHMCPGDINADECFTKRQIQTIKDMYSGPYDSKGNVVYKGQALGSESGWASHLIPYGGNKFFPSHVGYEVDHTNFLFYENDPGTAPPNPTDLSYVTDKDGVFTETAWWEFNIDDVSAGKGDFMSRITDAADPDLSRFLLKNKGKLIMYQGWVDGDSHPEPIVDYYKEFVKTTFKGDMKAAHEGARLFMAPGMDHCGGGPGPNEWDKLAPLVAWVEKGQAPDHIVAVHRTDRRADEGTGSVDNERRLCPYPQRAVYTGPAGGQNSPQNWIAANFSCK